MTSLSNVDIGRNLQRLRGLRGLSQDAAAQASGLSRAAYRNLESGISEPRASTLINLAKALNVRPDELLRPAPEPPKARFRSQRRLNDRDRILHDVARDLGDYGDLEAIVGEQPVYRFVDFEPVVSPDRAKQAADFVRAQLGLEDDPILDISGLLEEQIGVKVLWLEIASEGFFGLSISAGGSGPAIIVNEWSRISVERQIFTAAHELGHLLLHRDEFDAHVTVEDAEAEREADVFAAYLLMPPSRFQMEWEAVRGLSFWDAVMKIKRIFRVSYKTVLYRLSEQGVANVWARFNMQAKSRFGRPLERTAEPDPLDSSARGSSAPEPLRGREPLELDPSDFQPDRRKRLVRKALEEQKISLGRAAEILGVDIREMRSLHQAWA